MCVTGRLGGKAATRVKVGADSAGGDSSRNGGQGLQSTARGLGTGRKDRAPELLGACGGCREHGIRVWGNRKCVVRSAGLRERRGSSHLGCLCGPIPNWQPGTYLIAFFSLRPRPESGVPTVSKEFL